MSNFKLLVEKQTEIDTIYQKCNDLIKSNVTPKLDAEVEQMTDKLKQAKSLEKACTNPKFLYKTQSNKVFHTPQEVLDYYFQG